MPKYQINMHNYINKSITINKAKFHEFFLKNYLSLGANSSLSAQFLKGCNSPFISPLFQWFRSIFLPLF